jgi:hypothetical protein
MYICIQVIQQCDIFATQGTILMAILLYRIQIQGLLVFVFMYIYMYMYISAYTYVRIYLYCVRMNLVTTDAPNCYLRVDYSNGDSSVSDTD